MVAVDNGDPMSQESFCSSSRKAFNGKCLLIVKSTNNKGGFTVSAKSDGLEGARIKINSK